MKILSVPMLCITILQVTSCLEIYVDKDEGVNDTSCWNGGRVQPCVSLSLALEGMLRFNQTTIWLSRGTYGLGKKGGEDTRGDYHYEWMRDIAIVAYNDSILPQETPSVRIECEQEAGLTFTYTTNITIKGVGFVGCGVFQKSTSRNSTADPFIQLYTALYFLYSSYVTLDHINIERTRIVMYATTGRNTIANSVFHGNSPRPGFSGGGGLYIEFPYCSPVPSDDNCSVTNVPQTYFENSEYFIEHCSFHSNIANILNNTFFTFILPHLGTHMAFGRGAGISVFFKGSASSNTIYIRDSTFTNNTAIWGAGLFVEFQDDNFNNSLFVNSSVLDGNSCFNSDQKNKGTGLVVEVLE